MDPFTALCLLKGFVDVAENGPAGIVKTAATMSLGPAGIAIDVADAAHRAATGPRNGAQSFGEQMAGLLVDPDD